MRVLLLFLALLTVAHADEWVITEGGLSPSKRLAVAVYPQKSEHVDEADGTVLLVDAPRKRIIGNLKEVDSTGGTWGKTTENVRCKWSADSSLLAINFRTGRLMQSYQLYRIEGRRAVPLNLPDPRQHPKGKILEVLGHNANPGEELTLKANGTILKRVWGFMPKEGHWDQDYSKFGIKGFEAIGGELLFTYGIGKDGTLVLMDVTTTEEPK